MSYKVPHVAYSQDSDYPDTPEKSGRNPVARISDRYVWAWELTAAVLSIILMAVVVVILAVENGKALDAWHSKIPPNAIVSFAATFAKSSFLLAVSESISQLKWLHFQCAPQRLYDLQIFDEASRGPYGAMKLFFRKHRNVLLASWASLIVVIAMFVDPFTQLVFQFPTRRSISPGIPVSFSIAKSYDSGTTYTAEQGQGVAQDTPLSLQAALTTAIYTNQSHMNVFCPTGDCSIGTVTTLGVCGGCRDVTQDIQVQCKNSTSMPTTTCYYKTPAGALLEGFLTDPTPSGFDKTLWNSTAAYLQGGNQNDTLPQLAKLAEIASLNIANNSSLHSPEVHECIYELCAKVYEDVHYINGSIIMGATNSISLQQYGIDSISNDSIPSGLYNAVPGQDPTTNETFSMAGSDFLNLQAYLGEVFTTGYYGSPGRTTRPPGLAGPDVGSIFHQVSNISQMIELVGDSFTNAMRDNQLNNTFVLGEAYIEQTWIHVQWAWLALPIALSIMSLGLLIIVIFRTRARGATVWKSSSLAVLFHDLEGWDARSEPFRNSYQLETTATGMRGQLINGNGRHIFLRDQED